MTWVRDAEEGWRWVADPSIVLSAGPSRSRDDEADPEYVPPPFLGFGVEVCTDCGGVKREGIVCLRCGGCGWLSW